MQSTQLDLAHINAVISDMDGVLWRGEEILPGVPDFFTFLHQHNIPFALATNNSSKSVDDYLVRISGLGIPIAPQRIVTSAVVTAEAMLTQYPKGTPVYVVGGVSLAALLTASGYVIDPVNASVVVVGLDVNLTYDKLRIAGQRILAGADFIGTNADASIPTAGGISPGAGTIVAALQTMTGCVPRVMGKPERVMFETALQRLGTAPERTLMIGDRFDTDIVGAQRAGLSTALVLSGVTEQEKIGTPPPDGIFADLAALLAAWREVV